MSGTSYCIEAIEFVHSARLGRTRAGPDIRLFALVTGDRNPAPWTKNSRFAQEILSAGITSPVRRKELTVPWRDRYVTANSLQGVCENR